VPTPLAPARAGGWGGSGATTGGLPLQDFTIHLDALYLISIPNNGVKPGNIPVKFRDHRENFT